MMKFLTLSLLSFILSGCSRAPIKAIENIADTSSLAIDSLVQNYESKNLTENKALYAYLPPSRIPLMIEIQGPLDPSITDLKVYLLNTSIKKVIDQKEFNSKLQIIFYPSQSSLDKVYDGDTLMFKYQYKGQTQQMPLLLTGQDNFITVIFKQQKFQIMNSTRVQIY